MARKPAIEVEGARELRKALKEAGEEAGDLKDLHKEVGEIVAEEARSIVPTLTGRLGATIRAARQASGAVVRAGGASLPYAGPIHFGWPAHNIEPNPFLYDAIDARRGVVIAAYEDRVAKIAEKV